MLRDARRAKAAIMQGCSLASVLMSRFAEKASLIPPKKKEKEEKDCVASFIVVVVYYKCYRCQSIKK